MNCERAWTQIEGYVFDNTGGLRGDINESYVLLGEACAGKDQAQRINQKLGHANLVIFARCQSPMYLASGHASEPMLTAAFQRVRGVMEGLKLE